MQHEVFANPNPRTRRDFPFVVVMQADVVAGDRRLVAPLAPRGATIARSDTRALPRVTHDGGDYLVMIPLMGSLERARLRLSLGSIRAFRDELIRALDYIFVGF